MALPDKLTLEIVTPERKILSETVDEVVLPGREGYLGVLPGHAPLLASLKIGRVEYRKGKEPFYLSLAWGFAEVLPERVTVLAEIAEAAEEIDVERAQAKKAEIERQLKQAGPGFDFAKAQESLEKAIVRVDVAALHMKRLPGEPLRRAPKTGRSPGGTQDE
jgi:F-type H+-transporting ATPase subunit epsilon